MTHAFCTGSQCSARIPACEIGLNLLERSVNGCRVRPAVPRAGCGCRHVLFPSCQPHGVASHLHFPARWKTSGRRAAALPRGSGGEGRREPRAVRPGPPRVNGGSPGAAPPPPHPGAALLLLFLPPSLAFQFWQGIKAAPPCGSSDPETSLIHGVLPP